MVRKPIREGLIVRALGYVVATWSSLFSLTVALVGDSLTSKQWQYLMTIPGGKITWAVGFGLAAACFFYGLWQEKYATVALGWGLVGCLCIGIGAFYLFAPFANPELFTLGYYPWLLCAIFSFIGGRVNYGEPLEWF